MAIVLIIQEQEITHKIPISKKPFVLGRSSKCDLKLHDPMVSGRHCAFQLSDDGKATVKDLDSSNGTYVNGFKIAETHIMMDDEVTIGAIKCWLDSTQLNPKEKKIHVRETAKTRMKFINLEDDSEKVPKKVQVNRPNEETAAPPSEEDFDPKTSIIKVDLEEINTPADELEEDFTRTQIAKSPDRPSSSQSEGAQESESSNDRLAKRVKKMEEQSKKQSSDPGQAIAGENQFESEETGNTKFLKVDTGKAKKPKSMIPKKKKETKEDEEEGGGNLLGKIKGIFKK